MGKNQGKLPGETAPMTCNSGTGSTDYGDCSIVEGNMEPSDMVAGTGYGSAGIGELRSATRNGERKTSSQIILPPLFLAVRGGGGESEAGDCHAKAGPTYTTLISSADTSASTAWPNTSTDTATKKRRDFRRSVPSTPLRGPRLI
jgi:hypothetical protein